ncbi:uncharacterized protein [Lolium perenne]|uniref:uncharacterized protein n=1 Tax=Lolium perenne TaxID=4522 RepID=UPI0021F58FBE|nr:uncharacterized protein LOC127337980 [Lolium perenne]
MTLANGSRDTATQCSDSRMLDGDHSDWLHSNLTFISHVKSGQDLQNGSTSARGHGQKSFAEKVNIAARNDSVILLIRNDNVKGIDRVDTNNDDESDPAGILEPFEQGATLEGDVFDSYRVTNGVSTTNQIDDPYDYVYHNLPRKHHALKPVKDCEHCGAMRIQYEGPAFCCRKGKVKIATPEVPQELRRLFTSQVDEDAKYFRKHIRYFNSHFSFTSLGVTLDKTVSTASKTGVYTFRAQGALYYKMDDLVPGGQGPRHLQLYFYDTDETLEHRVKRSPDLDINIVRAILKILEDNPYVQTFKSIGSVPNLDEYRISLNTDIRLDQRRYNAPTASQVAAMWVEGSDPQNTFDRQVVVYGKGDRPIFIRAYYGCYDPLAYPLFFPRGETGWNRWMPYEKPPKVAKSKNQDDTPKVAHGENQNDNEHEHLQGLHQSSNVQLEENTDEVEENTDEVEENTDEVTDDEEDQDDDDTGGKRKFVSAREYYCFKLQQWAVDMYIKMETMRLDFFSKPKNQKRIRAELYQGVVDVIDAGETRGSEVGKRIVLPRTFPGDGYDKVISAEIPEKDRYPLLHALVVKHMLHGPCGALKKNCPCMIDGECRFRYPRQFCDATEQGKDSYPIYRRRHDGRRVKVRGAELDNRWVVPYNPGLLMLYNCHINVEACSSIKAVKYLFKYIYKGHDRASFSVDPAADTDGGVINEIKQYRDARFVGPPESIHRICAFPMYGVSPSVLQLQLHLENMQSVTFKEGDNLEDVISRDSSSNTMLTQYFKMNKVDPYARNFLYKEFPEFYRWIKGKKIWQIRKLKGRGQIGRIVYANPAEGERYFLRILMNHVRGATSYENLKTVYGKLCASFREACEKRGLIETDKSLDDCLTESATFQMPRALRRLFATILVFCEATNIRSLWEKHLESMSEDYLRNHPNKAAVEQMVLRDIRDLVHSMGKDIGSYGLPDLDPVDDGCSSGYSREVQEEMSIIPDKKDINLFTSLNTEQRAGFDEILSHIVDKRSQVFFVDGPGGTGKTYLYKALLAKVRSLGQIAIATATSGIAASIMPGGRTAHSRFKIPIKLTDSSMCNFTKQSGTADLLRKASLIIWDEVAMTKRQTVETLDRSLQDIMGCALPFGGKVVVFGGDFRQVLPVVTRGTRAQITDATLRRSHLWEKIRKIRLTRNMRAQTDPWFSSYLLRIGNGTEETIGGDYVRLPDDIVIPYTSTEEPVNKLIEDVFPSLHENTASGSYMSSRAILSTKNEHVDNLNTKMIERFPGNEKVYYSFDYVEDDARNNYPIDYLNSITPNGLPPHLLKLKVNCPVILLRNLDPHNGLCNGKRLMIRAFQDNAIDAEIVGGQHAGDRVFIPRIPLSPSDDISLLFKFKRKQFPIRLSFAMTINKAQGQTIPTVGIYLPEPVFSHGQLYVALSRGVSRHTTRILAKPNNDIDPTGKSTKNIVYRDVLEG